MCVCVLCMTQFHFFYDSSSIILCCISFYCFFLDLFYGRNLQFGICTSWVLISILGFVWPFGPFGTSILRIIIKLECGRLLNWAMSKYDDLQFSPLTSFRFLVDINAFTKKIEDVDNRKKKKIQLNWRGWLWLLLWKSVIFHLNWLKQTTRMCLLNV